MNLSNLRIARFKTILIGILASLLAPATTVALNRDLPDLFSYEPGVATPLGPYLMQDGLKGPLLILALNEKGEVIQTSRLRYDNNGRLQAETFYDNRNNALGEIRYTFEKGLPVREEYFDAKGGLLSSKARTYFQNRVSRIDVTEGAAIKFSRSYTYAKNIITVRETVEKTSDVFHITLDDHGRPVAQELADPGKKTLQKVSYEYDSSGRIKERIRTVEDAASRCAYEYDETGRLHQYVYYERMAKDWKKTKIIRLIYPDRV